MFLSLFCHIKQFCFPFPLLGVADFTLVERALYSSALLFWNTVYFVVSLLLCTIITCVTSGFVFMRDRTIKPTVCDVLFLVAVGLL